MRPEPVSVVLYVYVGKEEGREGRERADSWAICPSDAVGRANTA